jgi:hypothetical protein
MGKPPFGCPNCDFPKNEAYENFKMIFSFQLDA